MKTYTLRGEAPPDHEHEPVFTETPDGPHYGKETCKHCRKFLRWCPKPENVEKATVMQKRIAMLSCLPLTGWNRTFILYLLERKQSRFSPKQEEHINRIAKENGIDE